MRFWPIVWAGLWRSPARTILAILSITAASLLGGLLQGFIDGIEQRVSSIPETMLSVTNRAFRYYPLPLSHLVHIEATEGVEEVAYVSGFAGFFQSRKNRVATRAVSPNWIEMSADVTVSDDAVEAFGKTRAAAIVGRDVAEELGLSVGSTLPLLSETLTKTGGSTWFFEVVGTWSARDPRLPSRHLYMHYAYLDELRSSERGTVWRYLVKPAPGYGAAAIAEEIDALFGRSGVPTRSQSSRDAARAPLKQYGDATTFIHVIVASALFSVVVMLSGSLGDSVARRMSEYATLQSLGYTRVLISVLIFGEAALICMVGASVGLGIAGLVLPQVTVADMQVIVPRGTYFVGVLLAVALAMICTVTPLVRLFRSGRIGKG